MKLPSFIKAAINWFTGAIATVKDVLQNGSNIANQVKKYADSPLLDVAVKLTSTKLDDIALAVFRSTLQKFINGMGWAQKTLNDFEQEGNAKIHVLNSIAAESAVIIGQLKNISVTPQQALTAAQIVYDEKKVVEGNV